MAGTFSGHSSTTYSLIANPTTVTSTGTIDVNSTIAYIPGILGSGGVAWTLTNLGTIESLGTGGFGVDLASGGLITNGASGASGALIDGANRGIYIRGGAGTVTNFGAVEGTGGGEGIHLDTGGAVFNQTTGVITGVGGGAYVRGAPGTVVNAGIIRGIGTSFGDGGGVWLQNGGTVANTGTITSIANYGVGLSNIGGSVANSGSITGLVGVDMGDFKNTSGRVSLTNQAGGRISGKDGVVTTPSASTVTNAGSIAGTATVTVMGYHLGDGVALADGGALTNQTGGVITGVYNGVHSTNRSATIANFGAIKGVGNGAIGVYLNAGGRVTNAGLIEGANAVDIGSYGRGAGTVTNSGTIRGTGTHGSGVSLYGGGSVNNTGLIEGRDGIQINIEGPGGIQINSAAGMVTNSGRIVGTQGGVSLVDGGAIVNHGRILATENYGAGVTLGLIAGREVVSNFGTISDNTAGTLANAGILLLGPDGGEIINGQAGSTQGHITAYHTGIGFLAGTAANPGAVTIVNHGTIQTYGTIKSTQTVNIHTDAGTFHGFAVEFHSAGTVNNFGVIAASQTAGGGGVLVTGGLVINETGATIKGAGGSGVSLGGTTSAAATVSNAGTIAGSIGVSVGLADTGNNTVVNSGRIAGTGGTAVQFGAGNDTLFVKPGAVFTGAVSGGGGTNTIIQSAAGTLKVTGFSGFETIRLANGGADSLTLTSANFTGVGGHIITVDDGSSGNTVTASTLPSADAIIVHAGTGSDTLKGGAGNDIFYAGGKTMMTGGAGTNQFTFAHIGTNVIADFGAGDEIVLRKSGFNLGADESLATSTPKRLDASVFVANSTGAFTTTSQRFAYNTTTGALAYSATGSGSAGSSIVVLTGHPGLNAGSNGNLFFTL